MHNTTKPKSIVINPTEKTLFLLIAFSKPNLITEFKIPTDTIGIKILHVCTIKSTLPYSALVNTLVYKGSIKKTSSLELKVPIAKVKVLDASFLYLSTVITYPKYEQNKRTHRSLMQTISPTFKIFIVYLYFAKHSTTLTTLLFN